MARSHQVERDIDYECRLWFLRRICLTETQDAYLTWSKRINVSVSLMRVRAMLNYS